MICTCKVCGVWRPFDPTKSHGLGPLLLDDAENVTCVSGSVLVSVMPCVNALPPVGTVAIPNPSGMLTFSSADVLMFTVTGIETFVGLKLPAG